MITINEIEFLKRLRHALRQNFEEGEISDILSDYEDFFSSGRNESKQDDVICAELGNPVTIAQDLAKTMRVERRHPFLTKITLKIALLVVVLLAAFSFDFAIHRGGNIVRDGSLVYAGVMLAFYLALRDVFRGLTATPQILGNRRKWVLIICHICLFLW